MPEQTDSTTVTEETNSQQTQEQAKAFEAITSQENFDKAIQARIARERAKFADYDDLKARAAKFDQFEDSQKTEAQKQADALAAANKTIADLTVANLRSEVAEAKSDPSKGIIVPAALLTGSTKEELEASADALIKFKGAERFVAAGEGKHLENLNGSPEEQFAGFLKQQLGG